jgi:ABC-type uncharacterized transport system substrate-binding protein
MKSKFVLTIAAIGVLGAGAAAYWNTRSSGPRILFIDSYHQGYEWSDGITTGVQQVLSSQNVSLKIHRMDTKRNTSEEFKKQAALKAKALIDQFKPDIVIAADDNASKYLIVPYYRGGNLPFVFAGVNWDASGYGFPASNVTGMVEVSAVREMIDIVRSISGGERIGSLGGDTTTMHKEVEKTRDILGIEFDEVAYAKTFDEWKQLYMEMQDKVDILYMYNNAGIEGWSDEQAAKFVRENARIPSASVQSWMAPYVLVTHTKDPVEQGEYAAQTALRILNGTSPSAIPLTTNRRGRTIINNNMANRLSLEIPASVISAADDVLR